MTEPVPAAVDPSPAYARMLRTRYGRMIAPANDIVIGRCLAEYGEWAEAELTLLRPLLHPGDVVIDGGANIGVHSLAFARAVGSTGRVYAFEPQRLTYQMLAGNMALNDVGNVVARCEALGEAAGTICVPQIEPTKPANIGGLRLIDDDMPGLEPLEPKGASEEVPVVTIDSLQLRSCRLIKLDVEGMERQALVGGRQTIGHFRPVLYIDNSDRARSTELIELIGELDYRMYWHFAPYFRPDNFRGNRHNAFPNTADPNMVCLPRESKGSSSTLDPVQPGDDWIKARQRRLERLQSAPKPTS
jgi:FkbM family methyltransferase